MLCSAESGPGVPAGGGFTHPVTRSRVSMNDSVAIHVKQNLLNHDIHRAVMSTATARFTPRLLLTLISFSEMKSSNCRIQGPFGGRLSACACTRGLGDAGMLKVAPSFYNKGIIVGTIMHDLVVVQVRVQSKHNRSERRPCLWVCGDNPFKQRIEFPVLQSHHRQ